MNFSHTPFSFVFLMCVSFYEEKTFKKTELLESDETVLFCITESKNAKAKLYYRAC